MEKNHQYFTAMQVAIVHVPKCYKVLQAAIQLSQKQENMLIGMWRSLCNQSFLSLSLGVVDFLILLQL